MEEDKKPSYKGYGDIVLTNEADISYYKKTQLYEIVNALLIGSFNDSGKYVISEEISRELIAIDKIIDAIENDVYFATATVDEFKLKFVIEIEKIENNKRKAKLILKEECPIQGVIVKKFETVIASFIDDDDINFVFRMKKALNLYSKQEAEGKEMKNLDKGAKIIALKTKLKQQRKENLGLNTENIDKLYVKKILELLKSSGPEGKAVLIKFLDTIKAKGIDKLKTGKYAAYREILDQIVVVAIIEPSFPGKSLDKIRKERKALEERVNQIKKSATAEEKKAPAKKAKSASGGGDKKKKPAKKDAKKDKKKDDKKKSGPIEQLDKKLLKKQEREGEKEEEKEPEKIKKEGDKNKYESLISMSGLSLKKNKKFNKENPSLKEKVEREM